MFNVVYIGYTQPIIQAIERRVLRTRTATKVAQGTYKIFRVVSMCSVYMVIIRACIMDSEMPYFLVWSLCIKRMEHHAVYCIILVLR